MNHLNHSPLAENIVLLSRGPNTLVGSLADKLRAKYHSVLWQQLSPEETELVLSQPETIAEYPQLQTADVVITDATLEDIRVDAPTMNAYRLDRHVDTLSAEYIQQRVVPIIEHLKAQGCDIAVAESHLDDHMFKERDILDPDLYYPRLPFYLNTQWPGGQFALKIHRQTGIPTLHQFFTEETISHSLNEQGFDVDWFDVADNLVLLVDHHIYLNDSELAAFVKEHNARVSFICSCCIGKDSCGTAERLKEVHDIDVVPLEGVACSDELLQQTYDAVEKQLHTLFHSS